MLVPLSHALVKSPKVCNVASQKTRSRIYSNLVKTPKPINYYLFSIRKAHKTADDNDNDKKSIMI